MVNTLPSSCLAGAEVDHPNNQASPTGAGQRKLRGFIPAEKRTGRIQKEMFDTIKKMGVISHII
jgi:hypothetical protein